MSLGNTTPGLAAPEIEVFGGTALKALQLWNMLKCKPDQLDDIGNSIFLVLCRKLHDIGRMQKSIGIPEERRIELGICEAQLRIKLF